MWRCKIAANWQEFHDIAYKADDRKDLLKGIHEYLDESIVLPPGEYEKELFPFDDLREKNEALKLRKQQRMSIAAGMIGGVAGAGGADGGDHFDGSKLPQGLPLILKQQSCDGNV